MLDKEFGDGEGFEFVGAEAMCVYDTVGCMLISEE
jgi:hypothetical protein